MYIAAREKQAGYLLNSRRNNVHSGTLYNYSNKEGAMRLNDRSGLRMKDNNQGLEGVAIAAGGPLALTRCTQNHNPFIFEVK